MVTAKISLKEIIKNSPSAKINPREIYQYLHIRESKSMQKLTLRQEISAKNP